MTDFNTANEYETHFHMAIEYCTIDKEIYDLTHHLLTKRSSGSLHAGIINRLNENVQIRDKYLIYESNNNVNTISKYFRWS